MNTIKIRPLFYLGNLACCIFLLAACGRSPSYQKFMNQNQQYYAQVAGGCDELLAKVPTSFTNGQAIKGDNESIPAILRQLSANEITLETNRIHILIHDSRLGYGIVWELSDYNNTAAPWELTTYAEGMRKVVFSTRKDVSPTNLPPLKN